ASRQLPRHTHIGRDPRYRAGHVRRKGAAVARFGGSADPLNQLAIPTVDCGLPRNLEELHRSWITLGMRAMADASDALLLLRMLFNYFSSGFIQVGIHLPGGKRIDKPLCRIF